jgi:hypothetical protein
MTMATPRKVSKLTFEIIAPAVWPDDMIEEQETLFYKLFGPAAQDACLVNSEVIDDPYDALDDREVVLWNPETGRFFREPGCWVETWRAATGYAHNELVFAGDVCLPDSYPEATPHEIVFVEDLEAGPPPFDGNHAPDCPYRAGGECSCWRSDPARNPVLRDDLEALP